MTNKEFLALKKRIDKILKQIEEEAVADGENISSQEFEQLLLVAKEKLLNERGISLEEYEQRMTELNDAKKKDKEERSSKDDLLLSQIEKIRGEPGKTPEKGKDYFTKEEIDDIKEEIFNRIEIPAPQIINKTEIVKEIIKEQPITNVIRETKIEKEIDDSKLDEVKEDIFELQNTVSDVYNLIPEEIDVEELKKEISEDNANYINGFLKDMPNWRALGMGLQGQIDEVKTLINAENLWDRSGTTLTPHTSGDSVKLNAILDINFNAVDGPATLTGTGVRVQGADGGVARIATTSYGIAGTSAFASRHARGTGASPSAVQADDRLFSIEGWGYGATGFSSAPSVMVRGHASQTWTDANQGSYLAMWTTPDNTIVPVERMRILNSGLIGINTSTPKSTSGGVDIASGGLSIVLGADANASTRTNATNKNARIGCAHYTNTEEPLGLYFGGSSSSAGVVSIGGGDGALNAATEINFYAAANNTTLTGTKIMNLSSQGMRFGTAGASAPFIFPFAGTTYSTPAAAGTNLGFYSYSIAANNTGIGFSGETVTATSGTYKNLLAVRSFAPTSGTGTFSTLELNPTINQTGGANGITRGLYIAPTLTAAADFRALEVYVASGVSNVRIDNGNSTTNYGGSQFQFFAGSSPAAVDAKNFSINNINPSGAGGENRFAIQSRKDDGTFKADILSFMQNTGYVGIGTTAPNSTTHNGGSVAYAYRAITALRTLDATDYVVDCTANTFNVTLPTAVGITGRVYIIKNSGTGSITVDTTSSQTIDGSLTMTLSSQYQSIKVMSNNANWIVI